MAKVIKVKEKGNQTLMDVWRVKSNETDRLINDLSTLIVLANEAVGIEGEFNWCGNRFLITYLGK